MTLATSVALPKVSAKKAENPKQDILKIRKYYDKDAYSQLIVFANTLKWLSQSSNHDEYKALVYFYQGMSHFKLAEHHAHGDLDYRMKSYAGAIQALELAVSHFKFILTSQPNVNWFLAESLMIKGKCERDLASSKDPQKYLSAIHSFQECIPLWEQLKTAENADVILWQAYLYLGQTYFKSGTDDKAAIEALTKCLAQIALSEADAVQSIRQSDFREANRLMGLCALRLKEPRLALTHLTENKDQAIKVKDRYAELEAKLGLGLCIGLESQFTDKVSADYLKEVYIFYLYQQTEMGSDQYKYILALRTWLNTIQMPDEAGQSEEFKNLLAVANSSYLDLEEKPAADFNKSPSPRTH